jgi:hypothetical protein
VPDLVSKALAPSTGSIEPKRLERGRLGIPEEDRIHVFDDVARDFQEASFVLQGDQRPLSAIVHRKLQGLREGPQALDVTLNAEYRRKIGPEAAQDPIQRYFRFEAPTSGGASNGRA